MQSTSNVKNAIGSNSVRNVLWIYSCYKLSGCLKVYVKFSQNAKRFGMRMSIKTVLMFFPLFLYIENYDFYSNRSTQEATVANTRAVHLEVVTSQPITGRFNSSVYAIC